MIVIDGKAPWILELAWSVSSLAELGHEREAFITREYLHSMIAGIDDHQETSMTIERQASSSVERAVIVAVLDGTNRELDSSIDITVRLVEMIAHDCNTNSTNTKTVLPTTATTTRYRLIDSTNPTRDCDVTETIESTTLRERQCGCARDYEWMSAHEHER